MLELLLGGGIVAFVSAATICSGAMGPSWFGKRKKEVEPASSSNLLAVEAANTVTPAQEWAEKFYEYRDFLVGIVNGTSTIAPDKQIYKILELLNVHWKTLPGHVGTLSYTGPEDEYMSLTYIYDWKTLPGKDFRGRSHPQGDNQLKDLALPFRHIASGYRGAIRCEDYYIAETLLEELNDFLRQFAAHLLLHYRKSPTQSAPPPSRAEIEERYARQDVLDRILRRVKERSNGFIHKDRATSVVEEALEVIPSLVDGRLKEVTALASSTNPEADKFETRLGQFGNLGDEEARILVSYKQAKTPLTGDELKDAMKSLDKFFFAEEAISKSEEAEGSVREQVLQLANENKELAREELEGIIRMLSSDHTSALVRALRVDNKYLAGRQGAQLEGQRVAV